MPGLYCARALSVSVLERTSENALRGIFRDAFELFNAGP